MLTQQTRWIVFAQARGWAAS